MKLAARAAFTGRAALCYSRRSLEKPIRKQEQGSSIAKEYRVNERIRIPEVRVVDDKGDQLGVMSTKDALALARERDLDLVEVSPNASPPVCRLMDYGKFRYYQSTKEREMRKTQKTNVQREVRFRPRIGKHDIEAKERQVHKLLEEGSKVKVSVMFRGREIDHPELAVNLLRQVHESVKDEAKLEQAPNMEGRFMSIILSPTKEAHADGDKSKKNELDHAEAENA